LKINQKLRSIPAYIMTIQNVTRKLVASANLRRNATSVVEEIAINVLLIVLNTLKGVKQMTRKCWTEEECIYLEEKWGVVSIPTIASSLGRTLDAVRLKAFKLGLGRHLHCGEYITLCQLAKALGRSYTCILDTWIPRGFKYKTKVSVTKKYKITYIEDFWKWAKKNKDLMDFSKMEENTLGKEPKWVAEKRKADIAATRYKKTPWTSKEETLLKSLLNSYKYSYREISQRLGRTEGAIKKRMVDLGLMQRPIKADNHIPWTDREVALIVDLDSKGYTPEIISEKLGGIRSSIAVRGKLERMAIGS
jgi:hypothetical protein